MFKRRISILLMVMLCVQVCAVTAEQLEWNIKSVTIPSEHLENTGKFLYYNVGNENWTANFGVTETDSSCSDDTDNQVLKFMSNAGAHISGSKTLVFKPNTSYAVEMKLRFTQASNEFYIRLDNSADYFLFRVTGAKLQQDIYLGTKDASSKFMLPVDTWYHFKALISINENGMVSNTKYIINGEEWAVQTPQPYMPNRLELRQHTSSYTTSTEIMRIDDVYVYQLASPASEYIRTLTMPSDQQKMQGDALYANNAAVHWNNFTATSPGFDLFADRITDGTCSTHADNAVLRLMNPADHQFLLWRPQGGGDSVNLFKANATYVAEMKIKFRTQCQQFQIRLNNSTYLFEITGGSGDIKTVNLGSTNKSVSLPVDTWHHFKVLISTDAEGNVSDTTYSINGDQTVLVSPLSYLANRLELRKNTSSGDGTSEIVRLDDFYVYQISDEISYTGLTMESLYFTDDNGMVVIELAGEADIYPNVCIRKDADTVPFSGSIIVGVYQNNSLESMNVFAAEDSVDYTETIYGVTRTIFKGPKMSMGENTTAKAFFWNSLDGMKPFAKAVEAAPSPDNQYYGVIEFPEPFRSVMDNKFTITKEPGARNYTHTATPYSIYDWSDATEIFLSTKVDYQTAATANARGTDETQPITGKNFAQLYKEEAYRKSDGDKQTKFIFTLLNDFYSGNSTAMGAHVHTIPLTNFQTNAFLQLGEGEKIDALIRSGSPSGFTWIGTLYQQDNPTEISQPWTGVGEYDNVYSTVKTAVGNIVTLYNFNTADRYGIPRPYVLKDSIDEVNATKGTFFQNGNTIYCNPRIGDVLIDISLVAEDSYISGIRHETAYSSQTIMFENIGFMPRPTGHYNNQFYGQDYDKAVFGFFGCKFSGGARNAVSLAGRYTCFMVDSVAAYGFRDGFNYHAQDNGSATIDIDGRSSTVIELNCKSYMDGDFNRIYQSAAVSPGNTNVSNNASTVHDGMNCLRVGGRFWGTQGPIVADIDSFNITMGCEAYDEYTTPSDKTAYLIKSELRNNYIIDCYGTGKTIRAGYVGNSNSYLLDFYGNPRYGLEASGTAYEPMTISWSSIAAGVWNAIQTSTVSGIKTEYAIGEDLNLAQGKLTIQYDNGVTFDVPLLDSSITISNFDSTTAGEKIVNVIYKGFVTSFSYLCLDE